MSLHALTAHRSIVLRTFAGKTACKDRSLSVMTTVNLTGTCVQVRVAPAAVPVWADVHAGGEDPAGHQAPVLVLAAEEGPVACGDAAGPYPNGPVVVPGLPRGSDLDGLVVIVVLPQ